MAQINIILEKQLLTIQNREIIASGDSNYDKCLFIFDEAWEGFTKTAVFYQDKKSVQYAVLDNKDTCIIPASAMTKQGKMYIGVFGIKESAVLTSTMEYVEIVEGAISGENVSTEPTDDVFLAIISQYQNIVELMKKYDDTAAGIEAGIKEQNAILETINAFELGPLENRMSSMEIILSEYGNTITDWVEKNSNMLTEIKDSAFLITGIQVVFDDDYSYKYEDERISSTCIVNAYFDAISVEDVLGQMIYVESFDGYIQFSGTKKFTEPLTCTVEVRRY